MMSCGRLLWLRNAIILLIVSNTVDRTLAQSSSTSSPSLVPSLASVQYSRPKLNTSYGASAEYDHRGMEHLYFVTNLFLDLIQQDDTVALDRYQLEAARKAGNLTETFVQLGLRDWPLLLQHHLGFAILAGIGILTAVLLPFIGLAVCCARCAGSCGGKTDPYEDKLDKCKRICNGTFLSLLVIVVLFGLVASFVVNEYIEKGVKEAPSRLHTGVNDVQLYVANTRKEVNHLLVDNYRELESVLDEALDRCGDLVKQKLANISRAVAVDDLTAIAEGLRDIRHDLNAISSQTQELQVRADQLTVGLQGVQSELGTLLQLCSSPTCRQLARQYNLSQLSVQAEFRQWLLLDLLPKLPDVTRTAQEISTLIENGIEREVRAGKGAFDELSQMIQEEVSGLVPEVRRRLAEAGVRLEGVAANISRVLDGVRLGVAHRSIDTADQYLQDYGYVRYYLFLVMSCLVLVITFCLVLGLFCGFCGRRPGNVYGDDTCNKGSGANFLLSATFFFFLFGWLLLLIVTAMFLVGGLAQFYLCDGLASPDSRGKGPGLLQAVLPIEEAYPELKVTGFDLPDIIERCHQNQSIYTVLRLQNLYDVSQLSKYGEELGIDRQLDALRNRIQVDTAVQILTPLGKRQLYELAESDVARINYTAFTLTLEDRITSVDLGQMGEALEAAADLLPPAERKAANRLRNQATILGAQQQVVDQMADIVVSLRNSTLSLQEHVRFNRTNVTEAVRELIAQAEGAQEYLSSRGGSEVIQLADQYAAEFLSLLDAYTARVENGFTYSLARCGPLSTVYQSTAVTLCQNTIYPFNGYWAAVGWCLLFFVPCIIVGMRLTSLYRKTEPYSPTYTDNVREQRAGKRGQSSVSDRRRSSNTGPMYDNAGRYQDNASRGYHGYSPDSPPYTAIPPRGQQFRPLAASPEGGDTEPKAPPLWDLNGGPPGYSDNPSSSSYDRPPPYFYPGPGSERA